MNQPAVRAVVFDLDGLLVDSEPLQIAAWDAFLARYGQRLDAAFLGELFGLRVWDSARVIGERFALPLTVDEIVAQRDDLFLASLADNLEPMPGARELIDALRHRGVPMALATSGHRRYVDAVLDQLGWADSFAVEVTGDMVTHGKPAPDIYLAAAEGLELSPASCLALEDAPHGVASAKAAGMICLAIPNAMTAALPGFDLADAVLDSLDDVLGWLG